MPARVGAAIDVGSNSIHLLVARVERGAVRPVLELSELLGLGAVVDLEGRIPPAEQKAALEVLSGYARTASEHGAQWLTLMATEPLRRASNRSHFCDAVLAATGQPLHVLSHDAEAELTTLGVLGGKAPAEPTLLVDIGGGSSELILLAPGEDPVVGALPVGSARLTAGFVEDDPPTADEIAGLRAEAMRLVSALPAGHPRRGIAVGGSGSNLLLLTGGEAIDRAAIDKAFELVAIHSASELVARFGLRERRALQMAAGAALLEATMSCYGLDSLEVSDASLREGALRAVAIAGDAWLDRLGGLVSARG